MMDPSGKYYNLRYLALVGITTSLLVTGCREVDEANEDRNYQVSSSPDEVILLLDSLGGSGPYAPQYRVYGDGRLVRQMVEKRTDEPWKSHEVQLSAEDIGLLFQLIVDSGLPELTSERLREATGPRPLTVDDAATVVLEIRFESYIRPGEDRAAPFERKVAMHAPHFQIRYFPDFREAHGLVSIEEALDDYFPESALEVIYGPSEKGRE